ncbi:unnamed protein product, partial [Symbiodinium sp. CCMP2592]
VTQITMSIYSHCLSIMDRCAPEVDILADLWRNDIVDLPSRINNIQVFDHWWSTPASHATVGWLKMRIRLILIALLVSTDPTCILQEVCSWFGVYDWLCLHRWSPQKHRLTLDGSACWGLEWSLITQFAAWWFQLREKATGIVRSISSSFSRTTPEEVQCPGTVARSAGSAQPVTAASSSSPAPLVLKERIDKVNVDTRAQTTTPNSSLRQMTRKELKSMRKAQKAATAAYNQVKAAREGSHTEMDAAGKCSDEPAGTPSASSKIKARPRRVQAVRQSQAVPLKSKKSKKGSIRESFAKSKSKASDEIPVVNAQSSATDGARANPVGAAASSSMPESVPIQDDIMIQRQQQLLAMQEYAAKRRSQLRQQALLVQQQAAGNAANAATPAADLSADPAERAPASSAYAKKFPLVHRPKYISQLAYRIFNSIATLVGALPGQLRELWPMPQYSPDAHHRIWRKSSDSFALWLLKVGRYFGIADKLKWVKAWCTLMLRLLHIITAFILPAELHAL